MIGRRPLVTLRVDDADAVARVLARTHTAAAMPGLDGRRAPGLAAAAAEVAGNAVRHAGGGAVELEVEESPDGPALVVRVVDRGPGIEDADALLADGPPDGEGGERGLRRVQRLVARLAVAASPGDGCTVVLAEPLPSHSLGRSVDGTAELAEILARREAPEGSVDLTSGELLAVLDELTRAEQEVARLRRAWDAADDELPALRRELAETVETLTAIVAAAPLGVVVLGTDGQVEGWNAAAERIFGHPAADVLGRTLPLVPGDATAVLHLDPADLTAAESWQTEAHGRRFDGAPLHVSVSTAPLRTEAGRVRGRLAVVADVTERTRIEEERAKLLLAEQAARADAEAVAERMRGVQAVTDAALAHLSLDDLLDELLERIRATLGVETIAVFLVSEVGDALVVRASLGLDPEAVRRIRVPVARDPEGHIAIAREPFVIDDLREQSVGSAILEQRGIRSLAGVPLLVQGRETGVLHVGAREVGRFAEADVQLLQLVADRVGLAIEHARLYEAERGARHAAERAVERTAALQALTAALAGALASADVAAVVIEHARAALGATGVSVLVLDDAADELRALAAAGVPQTLAETWARLPLSSRGPVADAVRARRPVLLGSSEELRRAYPESGLPHQDEERAVAVVPLVLERQAVGGLVLMWSGERRAIAGDRTFLAAVADVCAQALERARLLEAERAARAESEQVRERIALLADAGEVLASSLDYGSTLPELARLLVPRVADVAIVELLENETLHRAGWAHRDPAREPMLAEMATRFPPLLRGDHPTARAVRTRRAELRTAVGPEIILHEVRSPEHLALLEQVGVPTSALAVPLVARGRTLGALFLMYTSSGRRYGPSDVAFAEDLARRAAVALDNARLYADRARVARTLQRSLLPHRLPDVAGLELAARYRPAGGGTDVGGDFYDVFEVAGGSYVVVMGDVCGKGADAAALTGLIRWTVRAAAMRERDPATVLTMLNEAVLAQTTDYRFATVVCARVDPTPGGACFTVACGGHPQPLVLRADGAVAPAGVPGSLIGALEEVEVADRAVDLAPGDAVVLFTDGVTEERDEAGRPFGEEGLAALLGRSTGLDAHALAGRIEHEVTGWATATPRDDIAVLVLRVPPRS